MTKRVVEIGLQNGMEARPVAMLVQVASRFDSTVYLETGNKKINAKSIMGMMSLGLDVGEVITVTANGADEEAAVDDMVMYITGDID